VPRETTPTPDRQEKRGPLPMLSHCGVSGVETNCSIPSGHMVKLKCVLRNSAAPMRFWLLLDPAAAFPREPGQPTGDRVIGPVSPACAQTISYEGYQRAESPTHAETGSSWTC